LGLLRGSAQDAVAGHCSGAGQSAAEADSQHMQSRNAPDTYFRVGFTRATLADNRKVT
jgi:hypothetical protein